MAIPLALCGFSGHLGLLLACCGWRPSLQYVQSGLKQSWKAVIAGGQLLLCHLQCVLQQLYLQGRLLALLLEATCLTLSLKVLHLELKEVLQAWNRCGPAQEDMQVWVSWHGTILTLALRSVLAANTVAREGLLPCPHPAGMYGPHLLHP